MTTASHAAGLELRHRPSGRCKHWHWIRVKKGFERYRLVSPTIKSRLGTCLKMCTCGYSRHTRIGLMKHIGEIKAISLSPDGSLCVTGAMNYQSTDRNALVWDVPSLSVVGELKGHHDGIYASAWSPIGGIIATG